jgi:hypothetical protein
MRFSCYLGIARERSVGAFDIVCTTLYTEANSERHVAARPVAESWQCIQNAGILPCIQMKNVPLHKGTLFQAATSVAFLNADRSIVSGL